MKSFLVICLGIVVSFTILGQSDPRSRALDQLVDAERAFAKDSVENGIRNSFIDYFADDGINFQPHPTLTKEAMLKRPETPRPFAYTLDWSPVYADVSRAGDLGYTTGPYTLKENSSGSKNSNHGFYFSIWKRQADGKWKVVVDCGIGISKFDGQGNPSFKGAPSSGFIPKAGSNVIFEIKRVNEAEAAFLNDATNRGLAQAYRSVLSNSARLHRNEILPITDRNEIFHFLEGQKLSVTWKPIKTDVASSADLAYTYGSYEAKDASDAIKENGYYVHVWKRESGGAWKLVLDTTNPVPKKS